MYDDKKLNHAHTIALVQILNRIILLTIIMFQSKDKLNVLNVLKKERHTIKMFKCFKISKYKTLCKKNS